MNEPRPRRDVDLSKPALWRWILFVTLCVIVVSFWMPPQRTSGAGEASPFSTTNVLTLLACVAVAVAVVPARLRSRAIIALVMVGTTAVAWWMEEPIRDLLGSRWAP